MTDTPVPEEWPEALVPYWLPRAEVLDARSRRDHKPGRDSLGTPGTIHRRLHRGTLEVERPRECVIEELEAVGLSTASTATAVARMERPRSEIRSALADPFLLEDSVRAVVRGRHFSGEQRAMVESKVAALHAELESPETPQERREHIQSMLPALEEGLKSTVEA